MLSLISFNPRFVFISKVLVTSLILLLSGCSAIKPHEPLNAEKPLHSIDDIVKKDVDHPIDIYDPWEGMNRSTYIFNARLDHYIMLPVLDAYRDYVPFFLRLGVDNFFDNLTSFNHTLNSALQLKGEKTLNNGLRFISNTTMGIGGIFDIATGMGLPEMKEDFGQTLGYWGVTEGPYLVLPFFGPSNIRDTTGLIGDFTAATWLTDDFLGLNGNEGWLYFYYIMTGVSTRSKISFHYYQSGSPFEYETIRWLYTNGRKVLISI